MGEEPSLANKILFTDIYSLNFTTIDIVKRESCQTCGTTSIEAKPTIAESKVVEICGKDAFMASPRTPLALNLDQITPLLEKRFKIKLRSSFGVSFEHSKGITISLMKTGNALIKGMLSIKDAVKIYDELIKMIENVPPPIIKKH